ncbi:MAG: hypothetical protein V4750_17925 [Pseudomonadota bacterium]
MKRILGILGGAMLASLLLSVVLVVALASFAGSIDPTMIRIDGDTMSVAALDSGDWLMAVGGVGLALLIVVLVVPLAVLIPLAIAAVALVGALLLVAGVLAMVFSPLIFAVLVVWLIVRLIRRDSGKTRAVGSATITG